MAGCCDVDTKNARDLTASPAAWLLWYAPIAVIIAGYFWTGGRNWLWASGFAVMGIGCVVNASRRQRLHCYFTGPLFLGAAGYAMAARFSLGSSAYQSVFADYVGSCQRIPMRRKIIRTLLEARLMVAALLELFDWEGVGYRLCWWVWRAGAGTSGFACPNCSLKNTDKIGTKARIARKSLNAVSADGEGEHS
jgi:hypothetical protein